MYSIQTTSPPSIEPVTTATVIQYLRLNTNASETDLIAGFITSAREEFEKLTDLRLITQTLTQYNTESPRREFFLMRGPIQSITSLQYYNGADGVTTDTSYSSDIITGQMGRIWWNNGTPTMSTTIRPVIQTQFVCGFGSEASNVPATICQAILLLACHWWQNRSAYLDKKLEEMPMGFMSVVDAYKLGNIYQWGMDNDRNRGHNPYGPYDDYGEWQDGYGW